ncbi:hypothetical protein [Teredinibacter turnerae]|uniref:hypothetical protein n=1 Tax=Teredinibacter turnerae TaxID=2426 RepID=UPI0003812BED|nr:hypothetical protein [Teredinibacter turnerae]
MKLTIALILLLITLSAHSNECSSDKVDALIERLKAKELGLPGGNGKLPKLTDHDYPIACAIKLNGHMFTWYTDSRGDSYIIKFESGGTGNKVEYFGVFHKNI